MSTGTTPADLRVLTDEELVEKLRESKAELFCLPLALALAFPAGFRLFGLPVGVWGLGAAGIWVALATGLILVSLAMAWKFRRTAQTGVDDA